jgi:hypothetical protein
MKEVGWILIDIACVCGVKLNDGKESQSWDCCGLALPAVASKPAIAALLAI